MSDPKKTRKPARQCSVQEFKELVLFARDQGLSEFRFGEFEAKLNPPVSKPLQFPKKTAEELVKEAQKEADELLYHSAGRG